MISELPYLQEIHKRLQMHHWHGARPVLAGGCCRNIMTGHPVRDIDIFTEHEDNIPLLAQRLCLDITRLPLGHNEDCSSGSGVSPDEMKVWKAEASHVVPLGSGGTPGMWARFDLLWVPSVPGRISKFPDYISRMWMNSAGNIEARREAGEDLHSKRIRYHSSEMRPARLARLQELYFSWEFIDLDATLAVSTGRKRREPDHAPFWWDLRDAGGNLKVSPESAWGAVEALCKGGA